MDDDPEWLRTQLASFTCPCCGQHYRDSRIALLAERDGLYFVDLDCAGCGSRTVAIVTVEAEDAEAAIADLAGLRRRQLDPADVARAGTPPVSADDVLEMHRFLTGYEGGLTTLMRR